METVDKDLAKELMAAKKSPRNFAVVVGASECALVLSKGAIPAGKIKEAKEQVGGGRALQGRCFMEESTMVFELAEAPPGGLDNKIRKAAKSAANLSLTVEVRQVKEIKEVDEEEAEESAATKTETGPNPAVAFKDRLKALTPEYQAAAKAVPAQKPVLEKIVVQAMAAAKAQDFQQALTHLDQLEAGIKSAKQAGAAPNDGAAVFKERIKALTPEYQSAGKAVPAQKPALDKIVAQAMAAAKAQNYIAALAQLDQLDSAIKEAKQADAAPDKFAVAFKDRLKVLTPAYQAAGKAVPSVKPVLDKLIAQTMAAAKAQDYEQGMALLDQLEAAIKTAQAAPPAAPPAPPAAGNAVAFKDRLKVLTPLFQAAVQADAAAKPILEKSLAQAMALAKASNFDQALRSLDQLEAAIKMVSARAAKKQAADAAKPPAAPPAEEEIKPTAAEAAESEAESTEEDAANAELAAEFTALLKTVQPKMNKVLELVRKSNPAEAAELEKQLAKAVAANQAGNAAVAYDLLTTLDARLTGLMRTAKAGAEIRKAAGPENVAFLVSKQEWDKVRQLARAEVAKFQQTVLADPETQADPRYEDSIVPTVNALDKVLDEFDDRLNKTLDEAVGLSTEQKGPAIQQALDLIAEYRKKIDASEAIDAMDSGVYGSFNVGGSLTAALETMAARLNKRLKAA